VEELVSIVVDSHMNVCLVATAPAISWLAYREYNTYDCGSDDGGDDTVSCCDAYGDSTIGRGGVVTGCEKGHDLTGGKGVSIRYRCGLNGGDRLTNAEERGLPDDVLISVCSYLHPRDVTSFASVNRSSLEVLDGRYFRCDDTEKEEEEERRCDGYGHGGVKWKCEKGGSDLKHSRIRMASNNLWKSLWYRDYGHVLLDWHIGREALRRSLQPNTRQNAAETLTKPSPNTNSDKVPCSSIPSSNGTNDIQDLSILLAQKLDTLTDMKYFYFSFLESYMDYVLAGQNTPECCFLGMHGHIFDFTNFAEYHPGLAEPIRLECGKDATQYFEDLPHSSVARKIARKLCVMVDRACLIHPSPKINGVVANNNKNNNNNIGCCGLYRPPAQQWSASNSNSRPPPRGDDVNEARFGIDRVLPTTSYTEKKRANSLRRVRDLFDREQAEKRIAVAAKGRLNGYLYAALFSSRGGGGIGDGGSSGGSRDPYHSDMHGHGRIHVYYDPFDQRWKSWYTRLNFQPAYCELD